MRRLTLGGWGWVITLSGVAVIDAIAIQREATGQTTEAETMSRAFNLAVVHPLRRWPVTVSWFLLTTHLFTMRRDPIRRIGEQLARAIGHLNTR